MKKDFPTMIEIDDLVISLDIIERNFVCDLDKCKGICCVHGESGAPLEDSEVAILEAEIDRIKPFLREEGVMAIREQGTSVRDKDDEMVTPLINGREECAFAVFEGGIARCGIENAWEKGATHFQKPISCHIYPIRVKKYKGFRAVNYDRWGICDPARILGDHHKIPVYRFVRQAIERKFGEGLYKRLQIISDNLDPIPEE
jgi:hypothetical protein